jgi:putative FmdB family regulatory protein
MPTYAYKCSKCRGEFEVVQRVSDPPLTLCTVRYEDGGVCTGEVARVIPSGRVGGVVFNGGGWAKDGYGG